MVKALVIIHPKSQFISSYETVKFKKQVICAQNTMVDRHQIVLYKQYPLKRKKKNFKKKCHWSQVIYISSDRAHLISSLTNNPFWLVTPLFGLLTLA